MLIPVSSNSPPEVMVMVMIRWALEIHTYLGSGEQYQAALSGLLTGAIEGMVVIPGVGAMPGKKMAGMEFGVIWQHGLIQVHVYSVDDHAQAPVMQMNPAK